MKTCLLVDDSHVIRRVARQIFESLQFECSEAENGSIALQICRRTLPTFILLDWSMPVMDGLEFIKELRRLPEGETPIVVFCSLENNPDRIQMALDAGANEYIMKPFDADIIKSKLSELKLIEL